jgi:uncharacterized protein YjbJ (UPF0337 family)
MPNRDEVKGKAENLKGRVKEAAGAVTGNKRMEAEGAVERVKGAAQKKVGEIERKASTPPDDEDED